MNNAFVAPQQKSVGKTGTVKRKPADTSGHALWAGPRNPVTGATSPSSSFVQSMTEWKTPAGVCASGSRDQKGERALYKYDQDRRHPNVFPPPPGSPSAYIASSGSIYTSG